MIVALQEVPHPRASPGAEPLHLLVDSTGLKLCGAGEWLKEKHGTKVRRSWRKLHLGVDADTVRIVASLLTVRDVDGGSQVGPLLDRIEEPLASFTGDGDYDREGVTASIGSRHPDAAIGAPPCSTAVASETAETAMSRFKRVIGCGLRSHADERRSTEVEVAVHVLNRMLDLGRPHSVRVACNMTGAEGIASTMPIPARAVSPRFDS